MSLKIESLIQTFLKEKDASLVADELMKIWHTNETTDADRDAISVFLILSGFQTTLKNQLLEDLSKGKKINWLGLLFFISQAKLSKEKEDALYVGLEETSEIESILLYPQFKTYNKFSKIIQDILDTKNQKIERELASLKQKLSIALNDKQDQEVSRISNILKTKFYYDKEAQELTNDIDLSDLKKILKKHDPILKISQDLILDETNKSIIDSYIKKSKEFPEEGYNICIALYQMEAYAAAQEALSQAPESLAKDWMTLDLLIRNKKYIEAMEYSFDIEKKYSDNPDTLIETLYYRALSLYELNEKEKAIRILESVSTAKPEHLHAQLKLREWKDMR